MCRRRGAAQHARVQRAGRGVRRPRLRRARPGRGSSRGCGLLPAGVLAVVLVDTMSESVLNFTPFRGKQFPSAFHIHYLTLFISVAQEGTRRTTSTSPRLARRHPGAARPSSRGALVSRLGARRPAARCRPAPAEVVSLSARHPPQQPSSVRTGCEPSAATGVDDWRLAERTRRTASGVVDGETSSQTCRRVPGAREPAGA